VAVRPGAAQIQEPFTGQFHCSSTCNTLLSARFAGLSAGMSAALSVPEFGTYGIWIRATRRTG
jgi:hypothetical protein